MRDKLFALAYFVSSLVWLIIGVKIYPWFRQTFFSRWQEAESPFYALWTALFVMFTMLLYHLVPGQDDKSPKRKLSFLTAQVLGAGLFVSALIFAVYSSGMIISSGRNADFIRFLGDLAVSPQLLYGLPGLIMVYAGVSLVLAYIFLTPVPKIHKKVWHVSAIIIIISLTFIFDHVVPYDFAFYAAPVYDLIKGLSPLHTPMWYGILPILVLVPVFKLIPLTLINLHIIFAATETTGFILIYFLCVLIFRDVRYAIIVTLNAILAGFLVQVFGPNSFPQTTFFRFGAFIPLAFVIYVTDKMKRENGRIRIPAAILPYIVAAVSLFWCFDIGLYTLAAFVLYLMVNNLGKNPADFVRLMYREMVKVGVAVLTVTIFISVIFKLVWGIWFNLPGYINMISSFLATGYLVSFPGFALIWIMVLIPAWYVGIYMNLLKAGVKPDRRQKTLLFLSAQGMTVFMYFAGRSHPNGLHHISVPFIIVFFWMIKYALDKLKTINFLGTFGGMIFSAVIIGTPVYYLLPSAASTLSRVNLISTVRYIYQPVNTEKEMFDPTISLIMNKYGKDVEKEGFNVISVFDTWYLIRSERINPVGSTCYLCYITPESVKPFVSNVNSAKPDILFVDNDRMYNGGRLLWLFDRVKDQYQYVETLGNLDVYTKKN